MAKFYHRQNDRLLLFFGSDAKKPKGAANQDHHSKNEPSFLLVGKESVVGLDWVVSISSCYTFLCFWNGECRSQNLP